VPGKGARFEIHVPLECFRMHQTHHGEKMKRTPGPEAAP